MEEKYAKVAQEILACIGGEENVASAAHCATRLRLVLKDDSKIDIISVSSAITLGAIASATAPAATLMVVRQYKADGPLTRLLLMVVAIDDAVGLVLFAASFGAAMALESGTVSVMTVLVEPVAEIALSLLLGAAAGLALYFVERFFHSRSKRLSISIGFVLLTVGLAIT